MTNDDYTGQIELGKQIVTDYIQKERPDYAARINALDWLPRDSDAISRKLWKLELIVGAEKHVISFAEEQLADAWGTPGGKRILKQHIDKFFRSLMES